MVNEPIGTGSDGKPVYLKDIWPSNEEIRALIDAHVHSRHVPHAAMPTSIAGDERWQRDRGHRRRDLRLAGRLDLHPEPALFRRHDDDAGAARRHRSARGRWRSSAIRSPPTTSRPAGAIKPDSPAGRYLLEHQVSRGRLQQLRRAPRQPRSDDARHLRQHPHPQPDARQCRGRHHHATRRPAR